MRRPVFWLRWSLRDLRQRWVLVLTLALVVALATGVGAGLGSMERWRLRSNDASFALLQMHDLRVSVTAGSVEAGSLAAAAAAIPNRGLILATQERLITPTQVDVSRPGRTILVPGKLVGVPTSGPGSRIDSRSIQKGRDLRASDRGRAVAVVESNFANHYGLPIPTDARLSRERRVRLVGQALQPEQFLVTRPGTDFGAEAGYAVLYAPRAAVQALSRRRGQVNELVLSLARGADPAVVERDLRAVLASRMPDVGVTITRKADEDAHRVLYDDARSDQQMVDVFAWLLLAGAAFASFNLVSRVVESQRREIGIGMALGVAPARLVIRPLLFAAEISLLGVAAGIGVGLVFNEVFRGALQDLLALPVWTTPLLPGVYARAAALGVAVPILAALYPVIRAVRVPPVAAIRVGSMTAGGGLAPLLERLRLPGSSLAKMPFRNIARTPRRTLMSLLGIAAVITILVALAGVFDSFDRALGASRDEALRGNPHRMTATLADVGPASGPVVTAIARSRTVSAAEPTIVLPIRLRSKDASIEATVEVLDPESAVWRPRITEGSFGRTSGGIVLADRAAGDLGLGVGDSVLVEHPVRAGRQTFRTATSRVEIVALHANPLRGYAYMAREDAALFGLAGAANTVELRPAGNTDALIRALLAVPGVASVESGSAVPDAVSTYLDEFLAILRITQTVTLLLAMLIAVNTMSIAGEERRREHATMLAFGTPPWRTVGMTVVESAIIGVLGTLVGLGLGLAVLGWIVNVVSRDTFPDLGLSVTLAPGSIGVAAVLGVVAVALAPLLGVRRLRRMDVPATLRVVE
ncbi:MAG TPA: FtsX-like permease family protein [Gaiellaceae bacterium]|nr:FtsX-like permease family protein [Gaiellaceae bacterium]